jgi:mannose-6-phosphate isomerase-like protein (cupin superfamily)
LAKLTQSQPVSVAPDAGKLLKRMGVIHKLTSEQTAGAYYLCEAIFAPESGSPLHIHHHEDEVIYVLEGAIDIRLDSETLHAPTGGVIHLPKNIPHAIYNPLKTPLKVMVYAIPGGLEGFFNEVEAALGSDSLNDESYAQISAKYGIEWLE